MTERGLLNNSPFAAQELYLTDEDGQTLLVVVVQATYAGTPEAALVLAEEQPPVELRGTYNGEPGASSYRLEPQMAPYKLATDVVLLGHAYAPRYGVPHVDVRFLLGPVRKTVRVFGDRKWYHRMGFEAASEPQPFEKIPLIYDRAFGGWDRTPENPEKHTCESRNPLGMGYHHKSYCRFVEGEPLPNLEDPRQLLTGYSKAPPPAGFGFLGPDWMPRVEYAGTYDETWMQTRMPLLPKDFDRRFFNAVPPDQMAPLGALQGTEQGLVVGAVPEGQWTFTLPGEPPPRCTVHFKRAEPQTPAANLDTVIVDTDARQVSLLWRAHLRVPASRVHDVQAIEVWPHEASVHAEPRAVTVPLS